MRSALILTLGEGSVRVSNLFLWKRIVTNVRFLRLGDDDKTIGRLKFGPNQRPINGLTLKPKSEDYFKL